MTIVDALRVSCSLQHDAFIYDSDGGYLEVLTPLLASAQAAGDVVLAVVPHHNAALLRSVLDDGSTTQFIEAESWYRNPVDAIAQYQAVLESVPAGVRALVIGEVQFGTTAAEWASWTEYEIALNTVFDEHNVRVICPYDVRVLPASVVEDARRTHPYLLTATDAGASADYLDAPTMFSRLLATVEIPASDPDLACAVDGDLRIIRRLFAGVAAPTNLAVDRIEELTLAFSEVVTNAVVHGGGAARVRVWATPVELICVVDDDGDGCDDVLLGFTRPPVGSEGGFGTWLARRFFDRVEFVRSAATGFTVVMTARC